MIEANVDYLQYSILEPEYRARKVYPHEISGISFYDRGYKNALGERIYYGNPNTPRALVIMSGATLQNYREVGYDDRSIIAGALANSAEISRIDFAITDYDIANLMTPAIVAEMCQAGSVSGTLANYGYMALSKADVGQPPSVETTYIGSPKRRAKNGIFRAYDKGVELDILPDIMARIELEEKRTNAHNSARRYTEGASVQSIIASRLTFTDKRMERLLHDEPIEIKRGLQQDDDTDAEKIAKKWTWLKKQVAPTLRSVVQYERDNGLSDENLLQFLRMSGIID